MSIVRVVVKRRLPLNRASGFYEEPWVNGKEDWISVALFRRPVERGGKINRTGFGYLTPAAFANTCASRRLRPVGLALRRKWRSKAAGNDLAEKWLGTPSDVFQLGGPR